MSLLQPIKIRKRTHRFNQYKRRNKKFTSKEELEKAKEDQQRAEEVSSKQATVDQLQKDADKSLADHAVRHHGDVWLGH